VRVTFTQTRDLRGLKEPFPSGHTLQLTSVVKYFGLILDKRLTRKMKNVMNKPYRTFWTCGGTFGKKPRVMHWIYTTVIRPILNYSSKVWWLRF
jgi:hypothetical protein